jgi:hypothetical protein
LAHPFVDVEYEYPAADKVRYTAYVTQPLLVDSLIQGIGLHGGIDLAA